MNMFATQGGVVELWVTKTDTYTSTKTGEIYASVQSIAPIPEGARGNAKGFEISEYNIEPTLLDAIVFEGQPVLCKFASVVRPTQDRFGRITNTQVLVDLLAGAWAACSTGLPPPGRRSTGAWGLGIPPERAWVRRTHPVALPT
ncbi:hypothetical protein, partial [Pseudomonas aeruginosa]|uniref:hypothetical protein n=1 Tax=Pseudomonas aeruginosa TaxID=287 RepID=UPI003D2CFFA3